MTRRVLGFRPTTIAGALIGIAGDRAVAYACNECGFIHFFATPDDAED